MTLSLKKKNQQSNHTLEPLRWLFTAFFDDGTVIKQDKNDTCTTRDDGTGSTFTDVLKKQETVKLSAFELSTGGEVVTVDLITGAFIVNGTPLVAHNQQFDPQKYDLDIVYFRETKADVDIKTSVEKDMTVKKEVVGTRHYVNRYFIGWKAKVNGKDKQVTIAVG